MGVVSLMVLKKEQKLRFVETWNLICGGVACSLVNLHFYGLLPVHDTALQCKPPKCYNDLHNI